MKRVLNYTLNFQNQWKHLQLARRGGERSPLETELRIVRLDQYENVMSLRSTEVPALYDFVVDDMTGNILPNCGTGKRDKIHSICLLPAFVYVLIVYVQMSEPPRM